MNIKELAVNGHNVKFVCNTWETRYSWGHQADLYIDDEKINTSKCTYYNRTWESYQYQSIMKNCLYEYMQNVKDAFIYAFKSGHNIKRLCGAKKDECMNLLNDFEHYKMLKSIYTSL